MELRNALKNFMPNENYGKNSEFMVIIINMYPVSEKCFSGALNNPG
jgi:hypothetical protein